jgi:hypothetical protein
MKALICLVCGIASVSSAVEAATVVEDRSPLLGVHLQLACGDGAPPTCQPLNRDIWIAKDGTMVAGSASIPAFDQPWDGQFVSGKGSAAQVKQLRDALALNAIGQQGPCVPLRNPNGYVGVQQITWYGRGQRSSFFELDFGLPYPYLLLPFCSSQGYAIVDAIETYLQAVVQGKSPSAGEN